MHKLTVRGCMTARPFTIGAEQTMAEAGRLMREHHIRHLPVVSAGRLVGMVTERDLLLVETAQDTTPETLPVAEAMTANPYAVSPDTSLEWVALQMAQRKLGSAVIVERGRVVGVLTTVDALLALEDALARSRRRRAHKIKSQ